MATPVLPKATDTLAEIDAFIETIDDPVYRFMLEQARDHYWAEVVWDVPAIMKTLSTTEPILYRMHGGVFMGVDGQRVEGFEGAQAMYEQARDGGMVIGAMEDLTWGFGPSGLAQEAILNAVFPGVALPGLPDVDPEKWYYLRWHGATFNPFDASQRYMTGEFIFAADKPLTIEEVDRSVGQQIIGL